MSFWGRMYRGSDDDPELRRARGMSLLGLAGSMWDPRTGTFNLNAGIQGLGESFANYSDMRDRHSARLAKIEEERKAAEAAMRMRGMLRDDYGMDPDIVATVPDSQLSGLVMSSYKDRENREWSAAEAQARAAQQKIDAEQKLREKDQAAATTYRAQQQLLDAWLRGQPAAVQQRFRAAGGTWDDVKKMMSKQREEALFPKAAKPVEPKPSAIDTMDADAVFVDFSDRLRKAREDAAKAGGDVMFRGDGSLSVGGSGGVGREALFNAAVKATDGIKDPKAREAARQGLLVFGQWAGPDGSVDVDRIATTGADVYRGGMRTPGAAHQDQKQQLETQIASEYAKLLGGDPGDPELVAEIAAAVRARDPQLIAKLRSLGINL